MARKGVLVSSEELSKMTIVRWAFEFLGLKKKELEEAEKLKRLCIDLLGLNIYDLESKDEDGVIEVQEQDKCIPLSMFLNPGLNEKLITSYLDKIGEEKVNEDDEYERLVENPDDYIAEIEIMNKKLEVVESDSTTVVRKSKVTFRDE